MPKRQSESTIAPTPHFMFSSGLGSDIKVSGVAINRQSHIFEDNLSESLGAMCLANATKVLSDDLEEAADATLPADETATRAIAPGARVELYGLQKVIELNGKHGVAEQWDAAIERWEVRLDGDPIHGCCKQRLREANLAVMACIASAESPGLRAEFSALSVRTIVVAARRPAFPPFTPPPRARAFLPRASHHQLLVCPLGRHVMRAVRSKSPRVPTASRPARSFRTRARTQADELRGCLMAHGVEHGACAEAPVPVELLLPANVTAPPPVSAAFAAAAEKGAPAAASAARTS